MPRRSSQRASTRSILLTTSEAFRTALKAQTRCGNRNALRKLASILVHEEWHLRHGSDEEGAYSAQLTTLTMLGARDTPRSEEHTSELQSQSNLVCRLLLEKKKTN